jgi:hypothetical protein
MANGGVFFLVLIFFSFFFFFSLIKLYVYTIYVVLRVPRFFW